MQTSCACVCACHVNDEEIRQEKDECERPETINKGNVQCWWQRSFEEEMRRFSCFVVDKFGVFNYWSVWWSFVIEIFLPLPIRLPLCLSLIVSRKLGLISSLMTFERQLEWSLLSVIACKWFSSDTTSKRDKTGRMKRQRHPDERLYLHVKYTAFRCQWC